MKCMLCNNDFEEKYIQLSHDVPCYLFYNYIGRKLKKQESDLWGRHNLCELCHKKYESCLNNFLILKAKEFSKNYFKEVKK